MTALLGGLIAALAWGTSTICSSRSSKLIGSYSVLAWVMLVGVLVAAPLAAGEGLPDDAGAESVLWVLLAGIGSVGGLGMSYRAVRVGKVGLVAPILATEGGIAALIAVAAGESLSAAAAVVLVAIGVGVVLSSVGDGVGAAAWRRDAPAVLPALVAACLFGVSLYAAGRAGDRVGPLGVVLVARLMGVLGVAAPLAASRRLRLSRRALPLVLASGVLEVVGMAAYVIGSRDGVAVPAVVGSQFAAVAALGGYVLFGERLRRLQLAGVAVILVGVALLSALQPG